MTTQAPKGLLDRNDLAPGKEVIVARLGTTMGWLVGPRNLTNREKALGYSGKLKSPVPGHGGDVWFVSFEGFPDPIAYGLWELEESPGGTDADVLGNSCELLAQEVLRLRREVAKVLGVI